MGKYYVFFSIILAFVFIRCTERESIQYIEPDIEMSVNDSIDLSLFSPVFNKKSQLSTSSEFFGLSKGRLYVKGGSLIEQKKPYELLIDGQKLLVTVNFWLEGKYKLEELSSSNSIRILLTKKDTTFFIENEQLFYSIGNMHNKVFCSKLPIHDYLYTELIAENGMYAYRSGWVIYVSTDLKSWKRIYSLKRGIKSSMVFVNEKRKLLFIEYTDGKVRDKHSIYAYDFNSDKLKIKYTFSASTDALPDKESVKARHIHLIAKDPYTGDIYVGTGDTDEESMIVRSTDSGENFTILGRGSQIWRTLSFIFTPTDIFWNTDSDKPQYLTRLSRSDIKEGLVNEEVLTRFPLINGALWCTIDYNLSNGTKMTIMGSNNEGRIYDNYSRTYGIIFKDRKPVVYELYKILARCPYTQLFPLGVDNEKKVYLYDVELQKTFIYSLK